MKNLYSKISLLTIILLFVLSNFTKAQTYANISADSAYNIVQANIFNYVASWLPFLICHHYTSSSKRANSISTTLSNLKWSIT